MPFLNAKFKLNTETEKIEKQVTFGSSLDFPIKDKFYLQTRAKVKMFDDGKNEIKVTLKANFGNHQKLTLNPFITIKKYQDNSHSFFGGFKANVSMVEVENFLGGIFKREPKFNC